MGRSILRIHATAQSTVFIVDECLDLNCACRGVSPWREIVERCCVSMPEVSLKDTGMLVVYGIAFGYVLQVGKRMGIINREMAIIVASA